MAVSRKDPKGRKLREGESWRNDGRYSYRFTDIRTGKVKTIAQQTAYFWMVLQPFISIDDFGMAVLSVEQKKQFEKLASDAPQVIKMLTKNLNMESETTDNLPNLFIKLYISKL